MSGPNESTFRQLKPHCIKLSQFALQARGGTKLDAKELDPVLNGLYEALQHAGDLDDALCDYVLFPILPLFRAAPTLPASVISKSLLCLRVVLDSGPAVAAKPEVSSQLLVLFMTLMQKQSALLPRQTASEQEVVALCQCLKSLLSKGEPSFPKSQATGPEPRLVVTGNLLADLLDVASSESVAAARLPALQAIELLLSHEKRVDVLRRFLPGVLSKLTRPDFTTSTKGMPYRVLVASLGVIRTVLSRSIHAQEVLKPDGNGDGSGTSSVADKWLQSNKGHLNAALTNVVKLKDHDRVEVREAVLSLCEALLKEAPISEDSTKSLLETGIYVLGRTSFPLKETGFVAILKSNNRLEAIFAQIATSTLQNLPYSFQSPDPKKNEESMTKVKACLALASNFSTGIDDIRALTIESISDCVRSLESSNKLPRSIEPSLVGGKELIFDSSTHVSIDEIFASTGHVNDNIKLLKDLIRHVMNTNLASSLFDSLTDATQFGYGQTGIANLWLLSTCVHDSSQNNPENSTAKNETLAAYKELALSTAYDASLRLLDEAPLSADWRVQALALEMIGTHALDVGSGFRPELSFALYPVVERLACQDERLRRHAGWNLQRMATACGYQTVQEIILQNADYLVNAVSIKLTDLEPRPEVAWVLQAAIRIVGAPMLPHLGDVTESVFSILDAYHGYSGVVESMFSVLGAMIEQAPVRGEMKSQALPLLKSQSQLTEDEVIKSIATTKKRDKTDFNEPEFEQDAHDDETEDLEESCSNKDLAVTVSQAENSTTKTVERIVRYGQYYLTYDNPQVRQGLLNVLQTGLVALRHDEDTLLPVVNDIWPVLISRVYDTEAFVSIGALETLSAVIECAGEFMSSRIEDEWDKLRSFALQYRPKISKPASSKALIASGKLSSTSSQKVWRAILKAAVSIITYLRVTAGMEDDVFMLFGQHLSESKELQEALRLLNPDYYWLMTERATTESSGEHVVTTPRLEGYTFPSISA